MFQVRWALVARDYVAAAWNRASVHDRERIMDAVDLVDRILAGDPEHAGESRNPGFRLLVEPPLSVSFTVNVRLKTVRVVRARVFRTRN
jgi:hypothetical protein